MNKTAEQKILLLLSQTPTSIDQIVAYTKIEPSIIAALITKLLIEDKIAKADTLHYIKTLE